MTKLELKSKATLAGEAFKMAQSFNLVRYRDVTYIPADYETHDVMDPVPPERTMWLPINGLMLAGAAARARRDLPVPLGPQRESLSERRVC